jgi:S1-C subfamily serine protease
MAPAPREALGQNGFSSGSGFLVSSRGEIVTNSHVVEGCSIADVQLASGRASEAKHEMALAQL